MLKLNVNIAKQILAICDNGQLIKQYVISTAKNGVGELKDSGQTPRGLHTIRAKIGANLPINTVFIGRRATGEIFSQALRAQFPERDWILSRILWLSGLERHKNRLGNVDSMQRYIYIHGTPDDVKLGEPNSKGCIRMRNTDVMELFDLIPVGTSVLIE